MIKKNISTDKNHAMSNQFFRWHFNLWPLRKLTHHLKNTGNRCRQHDSFLSYSNSSQASVLSCNVGNSHSPSDTKLVAIDSPSSTPDYLDEEASTTLVNVDKYYCN